MLTVSAQDGVVGKVFGSGVFSARIGEVLRGLAA
jgi:hypothetical protein